ncbi:MAG: hypothetical protein LBJ62_04990 [Bifidobacteriaceae bacterium]|jgi:hypothetical protein|nr:hypothetical protein [Bifidobacteriaceae bacterium]
MMSKFERTWLMLAGVACFGLLGGGPAVAAGDVSTVASVSQDVSGGAA